MPHRRESSKCRCALTPQLHADSITAAELEQLFLGKVWKPATFNRYRALLSLTFRLAIRNGKVYANPARLMSHRVENNGRMRFLSAEEEKGLHAVLQAAWPERISEFELALHTGTRMGEQYGLRWKDVDWERRQLTITRSKNGGIRHVPLNATALHALAELRARDGQCEYVCGGSRSPRHWFEPAVKTAGVCDFTWHDLRHTFASRLVMASVDIRTVAELMGHKTIQMTMRYAHLAPDHQLAVVEKLEATATKTATSSDAAVRYIH